MITDTLLARLPRLETLHLRLRHHYFSDPAPLLSTLGHSSGIHTVIFEFQFRHGKAKLLRQEATESITEWEDILLAWATTDTLNQVILVPHIAYSAPRERDWSLFDEYVLYFTDVFPRLRDKGLSLVLPSPAFCHLLSGLTVPRSPLFVSLRLYYKARPRLTSTL